MTFVEVPDVRERREAAGLTQPQLALVAGIGLTTLRNVESMRPCTLETVFRLADALNVDPAEWISYAPALT